MSAVALSSDDNERRTQSSSQFPPITDRFTSRLVAAVPINQPNQTNQLSSPISPAAQLVELMRETWKIPPPELIISVTGGAKSFKLTNPQLRSTFQKGLVSAAVDTGKHLFFSSCFI
jgi:hypothetical protein